MRPLSPRLAQLLAQHGEHHHSWGRLETTSPLRYGWRGFALVVYGPGTSDAERRLLWLDRMAAALAAIGTLAAIVIFAPSIPPLGVLLAIPLGIAILVLIRRKTKAVRARVHCLRVVRVEVGGTTRRYGDDLLLGRSYDSLIEMDRALRAGEITPAEHERRWAEVYDMLPAEDADVRTPSAA